MDHKALKAQLPLLWFDRVLRRYGPLLPLPVFVVRVIADLAFASSSRGAVGDAARSEQAHLQRHFIEAGLVYLGVTFTRILIYGLHVAGTAAPSSFICISSQSWCCVVQLESR